MQKKNQGESLARIAVLHILRVPILKSTQSNPAR